MSNVGFGLVGAGRIAQAAHLPAVARAQGARLVALCDPSALLVGEVAPRYGVPGFATIDELLSAPEFDADQRALLEQMGRSLALTAKSVYVDLAAGAVPSNQSDLRKLAEAAKYSTDADTFLESGNVSSAVANWALAVRLIEPMM